MKGKKLRYDVPYVVVPVGQLRARDYPLPVSVPNPTFFPSPVVLQWCYSGVTVVLQWCYRIVSVPNPNLFS
jgi:hypothetical protein